jgi:hypothetical protein
VDSNRFFWMGARAAACVAVGPLCLGGVLRLATDTAGRGFAPASNLARTDWEGLVTVALPLTFGPAKLSPALGMGLGWMHVTDTSAMSDSSVDDDRVPRLELSVGAWVPIGRRFSLAALLALDASAAALTFSEDGYVVQPRAYLRLGLGVGWGGL